MENLDINVLKQYESDGWLVKTKHPVYDLFIWNYSKNTQYNKFWDEITLSARCLITDSNGNIVSKGYNKFFNIEEKRHIPTDNFKIYDKVDGSYISLFHYNDEWIVCSKGSFNSDHSKLAKEILDEQHPEYVNLEVSKT